jgi:hypothetical protein
LQCKCNIAESVKCVKNVSAFMQIQHSMIAITCLFFWRNLLFMVWKWHEGTLTKIGHNQDKINSVCAIISIANVPVESAESCVDLCYAQNEHPK